MADNSQTTDPLAEANRSYAEHDHNDEPGVPPADEVFPDIVRDPGKGDVPSGTPLYRGSQASDF